MRDEDGFSLVEILALLIIVSALAVIAIPRVVSTDVATLPAYSQKLATDLRHAQAIAMSSGSSICLKTRPPSAYAMYPSDGASCPGNSGTEMNDPATNQSTMVILEQNATLSDTSVIFNSLGKPKVAATFTISLGNYYRTVAVEPITGRITTSNNILSPRSE